MGWLRKAKDLVVFSNHIGSPKGLFHLLSITLLSLLLPLSFLLLATLSAAQYHLQSLTYWYQYSHQPFPYLFTLALHINPCILYFLVSIVSIATLIHGLTGKALAIRSDTALAASSSVILRSRIYVCGVLLCAFHVCVGLGIEGGIAAGVYDDESSFGGGTETSLASRVIFLFGLHETTAVWSRTVVRPVVEDTVFGVAAGDMAERWIERVAVAASLGTLWWWRLREEVETLVVMIEVKREQLMDVGIADFVGWWLYYLTIMIGMVRVVKGVVWMLMISLCRRRITQISQVVEESNENDEKV